MQCERSHALIYSHPQHVMSSHTAPQFIRQLVSFETLSGTFVARLDSSGWIVTECTPYACRHSRMVLACTWKFVSESLSTTMCVVASDFCWLSLQTCSSWMETTPGT